MASGTNSRNSSSRFGSKLATEEADAGDIAAGPVEARDEPSFDRVGSGR